MGTQATERAPLRSWWAWLAMIVVVGGVLRLVPAPDAPLWGDEALSLVIAHFPAPDLLFQPLDPSGGLYYLVQKAWLPFGTDPLVVRLPSILFGTLTIMAAFALGAAARDARTGLWCAAFFAVSRYLVFYSQEARTYALLLLLLTSSAALTVYGLHRARRQGPWLIAALGLAVLALYCHLTAWLAVGPLALYAVTVRTQERPGSLVQSLSWGGGAFLLALPELHRLWAYRQVSQFNWLEQPSLLEFLSYLGELALGLRLSLTDWSVAGGIATAIAVLAFAALVWRREGRVRPAFVGSLLACLMLIYPLLLYGVGAVTPIAMMRTCLPFLIGFALFFALSIRSRTASILGAIFLAATLANQLLHLGDNRKRDWPAIVDLVDAVDADLPLLICADYLVPSYLLADTLGRRDVVVSGNSVPYLARPAGSTGFATPMTTYWRARVDRSAPRPPPLEAERIGEALYLSVDCDPAQSERALDQYGYSLRTVLETEDNTGKALSIGRLTR